ncbi:MAG TPA: DUF5709 domain-containing protein [Streptosporangiaceae bacterium]|jgi:hypothetical protein
MAETYDRSADPDQPYEYGGGTGDFERGEYNPGEGGLEDTDFEDDGVLDSSDTLEDSEDPYEDPLDQGILPADKWSAGERFGTTLEEEREGESLDQLLAEEVPDVDPYRDPDPAAESDLPREGPEPLDEPQPRAGRLVQEDEGAHPDREPDLVAEDVGIDAGDASAEEAAVHLTDEDEEDVAGGPEG